MLGTEINSRLVQRIMTRLTKKILLCTSLLTFPGLANAGTVFPFSVQNDSSYDLTISFADRQNCLEPSLMAAFIGQTVTVPANGNWST